MYPIYTIHRDPEILGDGVEGFRPERWFGLGQAWIQEMFYPFSHGPRTDHPDENDRCALLIERVWQGTS